PPSQLLSRLQPSSTLAFSSPRRPTAPPLFPYTTLFRSHGTSRLEDDLGVTRLAPVEPGIGIGCLVQGTPLRHHEARLGPPRDDEIAQLPVVRLHVGLPGTHTQSLLEELTDVDEQLAAAGLLRRPAGVLGHVQPDHTQRSGGSHRLDEIVEHRGGLLLTLGNRGLVPDGVDPSVHTAVREIDDLFGRTAL